MEQLFAIDLKNYEPNAEVFSRPSARAIIEKDGKLLLIFSKKYSYYKFPGGGIKAGEDPKDALIREVKEESGYKVKPDTIREYGSVTRRQKDSHDERKIFEQNNYYYFCQVEEIAGSQHLEEYEAEAEFIPVWEYPLKASKHNSYEAHGDDKIMIKREAKVLDLVDLEIRKAKRTAREIASIKEMTGQPDYLHMLSFVENILEGENTENIGAKSDIEYSRYEHTKRVLAWARKLFDASKCQDQLNYEDVMIATIFHDVGRVEADKQKISHAEAGIPITRDYLLAHGYEEKRTEYICSLVGQHSAKALMDNTDIDKNLLLLMEADLLDDMGALGVIMDSMIVEARNPRARFTDVMDHIMRYTQRLQYDNPMVTDEGKAMWDKKTRLVDEFVAALQDDLEL